MDLTRAARYAYVGLIWVFLAALIVQVFLAGLAIFGDPRDIGIHVQLGYVLHLAPVLVLVAGAVGRVGRRTLLWVGLLVITTLVQPLLPGLAGSSVALAALHPVLALVMFGISVWLGWTSLGLLPGRQAPGPEDAH